MRLDVIAGAIILRSPRVLFVLALESQFANVSTHLECMQFSEADMEEACLCLLIRNNDLAFIFAG